MITTNQEQATVNHDGTAYAHQSLLASWIAGRQFTAALRIDIMGCYCMGPQNGEPLCPCRMKAAESDCKPDVIGMKRELDRVRDFFQKNMKRTEVEEALDKAVEACRLSDH